MVLVFSSSVEVGLQDSQKKKRKKSKKAWDQRQWEQVGDDKNLNQGCCSRGVEEKAKAGGI